MAQELRSISLVAPAFRGINTEDSPIAQDPSFAEIADNAIIDKRGRIAARKGHVVKTTSGSELNSKAIRAIKEYKKTDGTMMVFSVGNNKILSGVTTLTNESSTIVTAGYTISADNWKVVDFNDKLYFFQHQQEPLVYDGTSLEKMSSVTGASAVGNIPQGNEVIAAYGRLWTAKKNDSVVYWSDLLIGQNWDGGTSGSINISKVWPDGFDEIVGLAAHNGLLIIFGKHSIVVYQGAQSPATMSLADTIAGVGCVDRDTIQHTGTDVIFLSYSGLRSFGRTIQEKSMPVRTLSNTITKDIIKELTNESNFFRTVYSPEQSFYLLSFVGRKVTYCFDLRGPLEDGSLRVTKWPDSVFTAYERLEDGTLYIGTTGGISEYSGYQDDGSSYRFKYRSPALTFGDASRIKMIKKIKPTIVGSSNTNALIKYAYDFSETYKTLAFNIPQVGTTAEFNDPDNAVDNPVNAEFNVAEFSGGTLQVVRQNLNPTGNGSLATIGVEADINGTELSLQEINILALVGKTL
jgi:hypothetical protein